MSKSGNDGRLFDGDMPRADQDHADFKPTTANRYRLGEVMSALQKAIRRSRPNEALFWTHELIHYEKPRYVKYFWRRLMVIASEECATRPDVAMLVGQLAANAERSTENWKTGSRVEGIIEAQAVLYMCRAVKSREAVDAITVVNRAKRELGFRIDIPEVAIDVHTDTGRERGKTIDDFRTGGRYVGGTRGRNDYEELNWGAVQPQVPAPDQEGGEPDIELPRRTWPSTLRPVRRNPVTREPIGSREEDE